ncbi:MAG: flagellar hook-associated protein FlgL [Janthinobacterium lividum]
MRISTNTIYEGAARITEMQAAAAKTQQQIASGTRVLTPSDDPIASAKALQVTQAQAANEQLTTNRSTAKTSLSIEDSTLGSVVDVLQRVQSITVSANSAALDNTQRASYATELKGLYSTLVGIANTQDGTGGYMFAGYSVGTQPFTQTDTGASYSGDQGQRMVQVGESRFMALNDSGSAVFENADTGNGTFTTAAGAANTGSGVAQLGSVTDSTQVTKDTYSINFHKTGDVTTYDVVDATSGAAVSTGTAFKDGDTIAFAGVQFDIKGAPADGDTFSVAPSTKVSLFTTIQNLITGLGSGNSDPVSQAKLSASLIQAGAQLDSMQTNVLSVRSSIGARLNELDTLDDIGSNRALQYSSQLQDLTGVDTVAAASLLALQKQTLEAAQQSYVIVSKLSLMNYL